MKCSICDKEMINCKDYQTLTKEEQDKRTDELDCGGDCYDCMKIAEEEFDNEEDN